MTGILCLVKRRLYLLLFFPTPSFRISIVSHSRFNLNITRMNLFEFINEDDTT
jgi:hypothetical protein